MGFGAAFGNRDRSFEGIDDLCGRDITGASCQPVTTAGSGRGGSWFVRDGDTELVLRHYRRGGKIAALLGDKYFYIGSDRSRSVEEFELLTDLWERGLPVPEPVAAGYNRGIVFYTAQLITRRIEGAQSWSEFLATSALSMQPWEAIGSTIAEFHREGVNHADLNAHNILVSQNRDNIYLIDFDKSRVENSASDAWRRQNLARLHRSLKKLQTDQQHDSDLEAGWQKLQGAYQDKMSSTTQ